MSINSISYINGSSGAYDGKITNPSVRYGRNAYNNYENNYIKAGMVPCDAQFPDLKGLHTLSQDEFVKRTEELDDAIDKVDKWLGNLPPIDFEYRYMPEAPMGEVNAGALMGAAYEEMGKRTSIPVDEFTGMMQEAFGENASAEALDLNEDKKIDIAEYSASILLSDIFSTDENRPKVEKVRGIVTNKGQNAMLPYSQKINYEVANRAYRALYETYNLGEAQREFLSDPNNLID